MDNKRFLWTVIYLADSTIQRLSNRAQFLNLSKYLLKRLLIGLFNFFTVFFSLFSFFHAQNVPERSVVMVIPRTPRKTSVMTVSAPS